MFVFWFECQGSSIVGFIFACSLQDFFAHLFVACMEHPSIKNGWFREGNQELWPGQAMSLEVDEILFSKKSDFQDVLVFKR